MTKDRSSTPSRTASAVSSGASSRVRTSMPGCEPASVVSAVGSRPEATEAHTPAVSRTVRASCASSRASVARSTEPRISSACSVSSLPSSVSWTHAAQPFEQLGPDVPFQLRELLRHRRSGVVQGRRGSRHGAPAVQLAEHLQPMQRKLHAPNLNEIVQ